MNLTKLLTLSIERKASDLHISAGLPPFLRIDGEIQRLEMSAFSQEETLKLLQAAMTEAQYKIYAKNYELDFALNLPELGRFRANIFTQERGAAGVFRIIPEKIRTLEDLTAPTILQNIALLSQGLVLVTGPTGSGKSTTLAAMIHHINQLKAKHIITIEDPIEFLHTSQLSLINQREIHRDTLSFSNALRSALREDPDILLIGELRDLETIRLALTAAETGHLVFATLHTNSAAKAINRIVDVFPAQEKALVRSMLSESLQAVISQNLIKKIGGDRIAVLEIMLATPAIRNLIREDKTAQMLSVMQTSSARGMQTLEQHLQDLLTKNLISREIAEDFSTRQKM